jgi:hypothetical protein
MREFVTLEGRLSGESCMTSEPIEISVVCAICWVLA